MKLLEVNGLNVDFIVEDERIHILNDVSFDIYENEVLAIIGETGCGKSVTGSAILRILPDNAIAEGSIRYKGQELLNMSENEFRALRGNEIAAIPQSPSTSLDPLMRVGEQVAECVTAGKRVGRNENSNIKAKVTEIFSKLKLPRENELYDNYPCELSGGMKQRILLSMGIIAGPKLLIVDEPTKAVDWVLRKDIVKELKALKDEMKCTMLFITHDLGAAALIADRIAVMYSGEIIESGTAEAVLKAPKHPYTKGLLASMPSRGLKVMEGYMPSFTDAPENCRFSPRCTEKTNACKAEKPELQNVGGHFVKCHKYTEQARSGGK